MSKMPVRIILLCLMSLLSSSLWAQSKKNVFSDIDPFAGGQKFTVDLRDVPDSCWCFPLHGAKVISPYGGRRHHSGADLKTRPNDSIRAAFDGIVTMSEAFAGYGKCIIVRHSWGFSTLYSHNARNLVKEGDYVTAGQVIALTGRTGRATTEHLHFEVRVGKRHYNPALLFRLESGTLIPQKLTFHKNGKVTSKK